MHLHRFLQSTADYFNQMPVAQEKQRSVRRGLFLFRLIIVKLRGRRHRPIRMVMEDFSLMHSHRIHVPMFVEGEVLFKVGAECRTLQAGDDLGNQQQVSTCGQKMFSGKPRIHVIADWVIPGERLLLRKRVLRPGGECSPEACKATDYQNQACDCYQHQV